MCAVICNGALNRAKLFLKDRITESPEWLSLGCEYVAVIFGRQCSTFYYETFHTEKLKEFCNQHLHTHQSTINTLVHLLCLIFDPAIHPLIYPFHLTFLMHFKAECCSDLLKCHPLLLSVEFPATPLLPLRGRSSVAW